MPPKRKQEGVYSILELSPEARERVLDKWRYEIFDQHSSDQLSGTFKEILSERGFSNPEVCWSLSSCQGDGVAFWGPFYLKDFFKWVFSGEKAAIPFVREAKKFRWLEDAVRVKVTHESRYCHWNSMDVELELTGDEMELVPEKYRQQASRFFRNAMVILDEWHEARDKVERASLQPILEWEKLKRERSELPNKGPKEWRPAFNKPRPEPLKLRMPPKPRSIHAPAHIQRMMSEASLRFSELQAESSQTLNELEEFIKEFVKDTSKELEKIGYDEIEYQQSDEFIIDFLEANEFEFDEDGEKL